MVPQSNRGQLSTIITAFDVLEYLARNGGIARLSDISRDLSLPKANVHRILTSLAAKKYVQQDPITHQYYLGPTITYLWEATDHDRPLLDASRVLLDKILQQFHETVFLSSLEGYSVRYIYARYSDHHPVRVIVSIGNHGPIHATATGKAILSRQPTAFLQRLSRSKLSSYTPRTITDFTDLERELEKTRSRGFALAIDEWSIGLAGVAAPILNSAGKAFAAAGITFPTSRFTEEHMLEMGNIVIQTAEEISRRLLQS